MLCCKQYHLIINSNAEISIELGSGLALIESQNLYYLKTKK